MEEKHEEHVIQDANVYITNVLNTSSSKPEEKPEIEIDKIVITPTVDLLDILIGYGSIGRHKLSDKQKEIKKLITEEIKKRDGML